jgi:demethylmenaquinone methyltransferase / 2-methoxy-6-polyprenyl-1,4-benzoquinol methylase
MKNSADTLLDTKTHAGIRAMFDDIAPRYDFLNRVLSLGIDVQWRNTARRMAEQNLKHTSAPKVLDVATGTGDLAVAMSKIPNAVVTGIDLSEPMLSVARKKMPNVQFEVGEAEALAFPDESFDLVSAGFGVRNFQNLPQGLSEFYRVLKPQGCTVILEPMIPLNPVVRAAYLLYFKKVLPRIASLFTKSDFAYDYLPRSVEAFPQGEAFLEKLRDAGFKDVRYISMTFETAVLYIARKR